MVTCVFLFSSHAVRVLIRRLSTVDFSSAHDGLIASSRVVCVSVKEISSHSAFAHSF